jgi:hypothetical protein
MIDKPEDVSRGWTAPPIKSFQDDLLETSQYDYLYDVGSPRAHVPC